MADERHPLPRSGFLVQLGDDVIGSFAEVSGLTTEGDPVDYREGEVTLRDGIFAGDAELWKFLREIVGEVVHPGKHRVTIRLVGPDGTPRLTWTLHNARPMKFTGPALNAQGNEIAIEELVLAHEGLELIKAS